MKTSPRVFLIFTESVSHLMKMFKVHVQKMSCVSSFVCWGGVQAGSVLKCYEGATCASRKDVP